MTNTLTKIGIGILTAYVWYLLIDAAFSGILTHITVGK